MKRFFRDNGLLLIIIAALLAAVLAVSASFLGTSPLANLLGLLATPFRSVSSAVADWSQEQYDRTFRYDAMEQTNEELRRRIAELEELEREYQDAIREKERLEDLLGLSPLSNVLGVLSTPFRSGIAAVADWVEDRYDYAFRYDELQAENAALRERVAELEEAAREGQDALRENERLEELLGLAEERPELRFEDAQVTQRTTSNWESNLTIDKGAGDGVAVDDCVIDQYGNLVGVVEQVGSNWSLVATVLDPDVELGGRVARTDDDAVLEGDFALMLEGLLKLSYLPENTQLVSGDQVVTSGLGEVYPAGLVVGSVTGLFTEADGLNRYAQVRPAADIAGVRYVYVITDFGGEE